MIEILILLYRSVTSNAWQLPLTKDSNTAENVAFSYEYHFLSRFFIIINTVFTFKRHLVCIYSYRNITSSFSNCCLSFSDYYSFCSEITCTTWPLKFELACLAFSRSVIIFFSVCCQWAIYHNKRKNVARLTWWPIWMASWSRKIPLLDFAGNTNEMVCLLSNSSP